MREFYLVEEFRKDFLWEVQASLRYERWVCGNQVKLMGQMCWKTRASPKALWSERHKEETKDFMASGEALDKADKFI